MPRGASVSAGSAGAQDTFSDGAAAQSLWSPCFHCLCYLYLLSAFWPSEGQLVKASMHMDDPGYMSCLFFPWRNGAVPPDEAHVSAALFSGCCREGAGYCARGVGLGAAMVSPVKSAQETW